MKNFLIVGTQRTGSSMLAESIGAHPLVACGWEWTQRLPWHCRLEAAKRALGGDFSSLRGLDRDHMTEVFDGRQQWLGFRRLFRASDKWRLHPGLCPALWLDRLEAHLRWLSRRPDIRVIHIVRLDAVEWLKSRALARSTGIRWGRSYPNGVRVEIPLREAVARLRAKDWVDGRLATLARTNPYLQVGYEELAADPDGVASRALRFLDCDAAATPVRPRRLQKQSRARAAEYVENYRQLVDELRRRELSTARFAGVGTHGIRYPASL
ncbi:MAG: sulfotransferase [Gammaproteobacteria bacterium]